MLKRLESRKINVELTDAARDYLVEEGYDPAYGARPLKRTIQRRVLDPLALRVLEGEFREGRSVVVDADGDGIVFRKVPVETPAWRLTAKAKGARKPGLNAGPDPEPSAP